MLCLFDNVCLYFKEKRSELVYYLSMFKEDYFFILCSYI